MFDIFSSIKVGKSYWKLNIISLLDDDEIIDQFADLWQHIISRQRKYDDLLGWWEEAKRKI